MAKNKKGAKAAVDETSWDEALINEITNDDTWSPYLIFLVPENADAEVQVQALGSVIRQGNRRRFIYYSKQDLLQIAQDDVKRSATLAQPAGGGGKKSKLGSTISLNKPMHIQVCEHMVTAMSSEEPIPPSLFARMIKYVVCKKRASDIAERDQSTQLVQGSETEFKKGEKKKRAGSGKRVGSGRTSKAAGKKGKETPIPDNMAGAITIPTKPPTKMKKRGEEDLEAKYLNDEPNDGPDCYFIMTGFHRAQLFELLTSVKLASNVLVRIVGSECPSISLSAKKKSIDIEEGEVVEPTEDEIMNQALKEFWHNIDKSIESSPNESVLRDMARICVTLKSHTPPENEAKSVEYYQDIFDEVAKGVYALLEKYTQYQHYLSYLDVLSIPPLPFSTENKEESSTPTSNGNKQDKEKEKESEKIKADTRSVESKVDLSKGTDVKHEKSVVDMRHYHDILKALPEENITTPSLLHAMVEQVSLSINEHSRIEPILSTNNMNKTNKEGATELSRSTTDVDTNASIAINPIIASELANMMNYLHLSEEDKEQLGMETTTIEITEVPKQIIISYGDEMAQRNINIQRSSAYFEERVIGLAGHNSLLKLQASSTPYLKAQIHALNDTFKSTDSEDFTPASFNLALIVLSLENMNLQPASAPQRHHYIKPSMTPMLFDHPFNLKIISKDKSIVPISDENQNSPSVSDMPPTITSYTLELDEPQHRLVDYSVLEMFELNSLLQKLISLEVTHPYMEIFEHQHSESVILVLHTGFDNSPVHTYTSSSHIHTRVGFQNFLHHITARYGQTVDDAVKEYELKKKALEEERKTSINNQKRMELFTPTVENITINKSPSGPQSPLKSSAGSRRSPTSPRKSASPQKSPTSPRKSPSKKGQAAAAATMSPHSPDINIQPTEVEIPDLKKEKLFTGYDMGDVVLLNEADHTTVFTGDGAIIRCVRHVAMDGTFPSEVTLLHNGHKVSCIQVECDTSSDDDSCNQENESEMETSSSSSLSNTLPKLPPRLKNALLQAKFKHSLCLSCSHYGPMANGKIMDIPIPEQQPLMLDISSNTSDGSRQHATPSPKLTKKQQEQQQQLLEQQQRALDAQRKELLEAAKAKHKRECETVIRNNKYQQLFLSTEFGLEVSCQTLVNADSDPSIMDGSDACVVIKQKYSFPGTATRLSKSITDERCRYYHPQGFIIKCMRDGSFIILCADGSKYHSASNKEVTLFKNAIAAAEQKKAGSSPARSSRASKTISAAAKVTFSETVKKQKEKDSIWVVTTPAGECYLMKHEEEIKKPETTEGSATGVSLTDCDGENANTSEGSNKKEKPVVVPLTPIHVLSTTDPVTKEVYITREDNIVIVRSPDNSLVSEFEDGTRFTLSAPKNPKESPVLANVVMECSGFSRVSYDIDTQQCKILFSDNSTVVCSRNGTYTVHKEGSYDLHIKSSGEALYTIADAVYTLNHTSQNQVFHCQDRLNNTFSMNPEGRVSIQAPKPVKHKAFDPHYFILNSDGSAFQLHENNSVNEIISKAESDPEAVVLKDLAVVDGASSTTVIEPIHNPKVSPNTVPYQKDTIVPYNLRTGEITEPAVPNKSEKIPKFGTLLGTGLSIGTYEKLPVPKVYEAPLGYKHRSFLHFPPLDDGRREQVHDLVASFIRKCKEQTNESESMQPIEYRSKSEIQLAEDIWMKFAESNLFGDIPNLYEEGITKPKDEPQTIVPPGLSEEGIEYLKNSKSELQEAADILSALRNKIIPPYFHWEQGKKCLPLLSPDMPYLSSKLARAPPTLSEVMTTSQSSLQSSSVTLTMDESDSPCRNEFRSTTSNSKIRLSHPTPDHAQGKASPTETRPSNPSPPNTSTLPSLTAPGALSADDTYASTVTYNVMGNVRAASVPIPRSILGSRPGEEPNLKFTTVEQPVQRKILTCSSVSSGSKLKGFEVIPGEINFGVLKEGHTYTYKFILRNAGINFSHFKIKQPPPSTGIKVIYTPGAVAAGLTRPVTVELFAMAVGAVGELGTGSIFHDLEITSESTILHLPIKANVLTSSLYNSQQPPHKLAFGVELIPDSARKSVTRPSKLTQD